MYLKCNLPLRCHQHLGMVMSHLSSVLPGEIIDVIAVVVTQAA